MKYRLFRKNHRDFKNYILIGSLIAVTLFNGTTQAMDDQSSGITATLKSSSSSVREKLEKDLETTHETARANKTDWKNNGAGFLISKEHYVAEQHLNLPSSQFSTPVPWDLCEPCLKQRDHVTKYITPLIKDNEGLNATNALLENKIKDLTPLTQKNEELSAANARLLAKIEALEQEREAIYNSTADTTSKTLASSLVAIMEASEVNVSHLDVNDPAFGEKCLSLLLQKKFGQS